MAGSGSPSAKEGHLALSAAGPARVAPIDAARGVALLAMIAYHFSFDLRYFGLTRSDFEHDPFWLTARALIVTSFLLLVGMSALLAGRSDRPDAFRRYLQRTAIIAACAAAVSAASYALFPESFIYFGILHAIVVMSMVAWPFARHPRAALVVGLAIVALGLLVSHPFFDTRALSVIGFTTHKPITEDYVPLFPWTGVVLIGIVLGAALERRAFVPIGGLARLPAWVHYLGRHSLAVYMIHQPILIGTLWVVLWIARRP